jgi:peptide alpha-N-acetyltransferase
MLLVTKSEEQYLMMTTTNANDAENDISIPDIEGIDFVDYVNEEQLDDVMHLVGKDLSEPYSVFTYRYFLHRWPQLCILAVPSDSKDLRPIGCVVCKIDVKGDEGHESNGNGGITPEYTGYIGMLAVETSYRRSGIGTALALRAIQRMQKLGCQSIQLETEVTNEGAQKLYEDRLGFIREEMLVKYYLNWNNAYRLRLWLK